MLRRPLPVLSRSFFIGFTMFTAAWPSLAALGGNVETLPPIRRDSGPRETWSRAVATKYMK